MRDSAAAQVEVKYAGTKAAKNRREIVKLENVTSIRQKAIKAAWEGCETNAEAAEALRAMMETDQDVYDAIVGPILKSAAETAVAEYKVERRSYHWQRPVAPDNRVALLARANRASILDEWRLHSGKTLGDATADDIRSELALYREAERQAASKAKFFTAILGKIHEGKTVRQSMTALDVDEMRGS